MIGHFISSLHLSVEDILDCLDQQILLKILLGMDYLETTINQNMIGDGAIAIFFVNFPLGIHHHRIGQLMLRGP
jgi:hypothetical protein